jgi:hypothetical protein
VGRASAEFQTFEWVPEGFWGLFFDLSEVFFFPLFVVQREDEEPVMLVNIDGRLFDTYLPNRRDERGRVIRRAVSRVHHSHPVGVGSATKNESDEYRRWRWQYERG